MNSEEEDLEPLKVPVFVEIPRFDKETYEEQELYSLIENMRVVKSWGDFPTDRALNADYYGRAKAEAFDNGGLIDSIESFIGCIENGIYPPTTVLRWIKEAFIEYLDSAGKKSIDECLGLKEKGKIGRGTIVSKVRQQRNNYYYSHIMHILVDVFSVSIGDAANMLAERQKAQGDEECPKNATLEDYFRKEWKPSGLASGSYHGFDEQERKRSFLSSFPNHTIPDELKKSFGMD